MLVDARDTATGDVFTFDLNFPARSGATYTFTWFDGRRREMTVTRREAAPDGGPVTRAAFDVSSHEINVQEGR